MLAAVVDGAAQSSKA